MSCQEWITYYNEIHRIKYNHNVRCWLQHDLILGTVQVWGCDELDDDDAVMKHWKQNNRSNSA